MNKKGYYIMIKMSILPNLLLTTKTWLLLLLSRFSRVQLCATPQMAARQAQPSLGFSRQEHWSGLPFTSPIHESEVAQSCLTLHDPMDCSLPGSSVHGIFQARVLEWGAIAFFDFDLRDDLSRSVGAQYTTGDEWRNNSRKNEEMEPKQKQHLVGDVVMEARSDAVNSNIAQEPGMLGP